MYQQDIEGKKMSPLAGVGVVILIVISIMAAGFLEQIIAQLIGSGIGTVIVWGLVAVEAVFVLRLNIRRYRYMLADGRLFIQSRYGDSVRTMYDIPVSDIVEVGPQEKVFERFGNGQTFDKLIVKDYEVPVSAMAYRKDGAVKLLMFQPDEKMLTLLSGQEVDED